MASQTTMWAFSKACDLVHKYESHFSLHHLRLESLMYNRKTMFLDRMVLTSAQNFTIEFVSSTYAGGPASRSKSRPRPRTVGTLAHWSQSRIFVDCRCLWRRASDTTAQLYGFCAVQGAVNATLHCMYHWRRTCSRWSFHSWWGGNYLRLAAWALTKSWRRC